MIAYTHTYPGVVVSPRAKPRLTLQDVLQRAVRDDHVVVVTERPEPPPAPAVVADTHGCPELAEFREKIADLNAQIKQAHETIDRQAEGISNLKKLSDLLTANRKAIEDLRAEFQKAGYTGHLLDAAKVALADLAAYKQRALTAEATLAAYKAQHEGGEQQNDHAQTGTTSTTRAAGECERARQQPARKTTG